MTKHNSKKMIVLTAGGTGGHIYPAESLAVELEKRGYSVMLFTDKRGLNNYKGKLGEIPNKSILSGSIVGKSLLTKLQSLLKISLGFWQAIFWLIIEKPVCVVGFGGYASFPTSLAASFLRIPLILHEQNSVMSRTNRILARFASVIAQSFRNVLNVPSNTHSILTGMPIRENISALHNQPLKDYTNKKQFTILILGGSQGARIFTTIVPQAIKLLSPSVQQNLTIYQQCRKGEESELQSAYQDTSATVNIQSFFNNMPELYQTSDFIISRSGASSVYEIAATNLPSILVPLPTAADNHQYNNALEFSKTNAGIILDQNNFTAENLKNIIAEFLTNPQKLNQMSSSAHNLAITDASHRLADIVEKFKH